MASCIGCKHWNPTAPAEWKPRYNGEKFRAYTARQYICETGEFVFGKCTHYPKWEDTRADHFCNLFSESVELSFDSEIHGTWKEERYERAEAENKELRRQLKVARRISVSRLARLRGNRQ